MAMNAQHYGKLFEEDFKNSVPPNIWLYRIEDSSNSFSGGNASRFTSTSRYDYLMYQPKYGYLYAIELKSTQSTSITMCDYPLSLEYENTVKKLDDFRNEIKSKKKLSAQEKTNNKEYITILKGDCKVLKTKCKASSIKYHQINNLLSDDRMGLKSIFLFDFRKNNTTYCMEIKKFDNFWKSTNKKSINESDILEYGGFIVPKKQIGKSSRWEYDLEKILLL